MSRSTTAPIPRARRRRPATLLSLLAVAVALLAATASTDDTEEPRRVDEGREEGQPDPTGSGSTGDSGQPAGGGEPGAFRIGDLVELDTWQVRVHGLTDPVESADIPLTPPAGQRWVAVDVEVTNTGDQAETVSSMLCFELRDGQNQGYSMTVTGISDQLPPDGDVAPGASLRGRLEYEVPADAGGLQLSFQCPLSQAAATISLGG